MITWQWIIFTSYSTPEKQSYPALRALSVTTWRTPRGSTLRGSFVSGSRKKTRKKGTLFSQGIRRKDDKSMTAVTSRYPFALLDIRSSFEYTVSWISHPLHISLECRQKGKKKVKFYKITLQNPNPSDFAALKNFSLDWERNQPFILLESWDFHHEFTTKDTVHFQAYLALHFGSYIPIPYHQCLKIVSGLVQCQLEDLYLLHTSNLDLDVICELSSYVLVWLWGGGCRHYS